MSALAQIASKAARLEGTGDLDIRSMISDAAKTAVNAKRQGLSLREAASQIDMDEDPNAYRVLQLFAVNPRSNKRVIEILSRILDRAYEESHRDRYYKRDGKAGQYTGQTGPHMAPQNAAGGLTDKGIHHSFRCSEHQWPRIGGEQPDCNRNGQ